jgi:hypothetical protein
MLTLPPWIDKARVADDMTTPEWYTMASTMDGVDQYCSPALTPWSPAATPSSQHDPPSTRRQAIR